MKNFVNKFGFYIGMVLCIIIFLILAFKDPFSERSLIPNLEPYPDSLVYSYPSWNLVNGKSFQMDSDGIIVRTTVPPSYGIYLLPFLAIFKDIRVFYFANIILTLVSIVFFFLITKEIFKNSFISFILSGVLVTSYYFYLLPQFLMAENISLTLLLILFWFLIRPISIKNIIYFSLFNAIFILIKISNLSVFISLVGLYFLKDLKEKNKIIIIKFILISLIFYGVVLFWMFKSMMSNTGIAAVNQLTTFSFSYLKNNFNYYIRAIVGDNGRFIWMSERFITRDLTMWSGLGLLLAMMQKKGRQIIFLILGIMLPLFLYMGCYYFPDTRYINLIYPLILLPIGFIINKLKNKKVLIIFLLFFGIVDFGLMSIKANFEPKIITIKKQIGLNFRHAEQPWNYLAVKNFNNYFKEKKDNVYLANFLPAYYLHYFENGNYKYLPISNINAFPEYVSKKCPNGIIDCYKNILDDGGEIYLSDYYISNDRKTWERDLNKIKDNFILTKVFDGCFNVCNIYKLEKLKTDNVKKK